MGPRVRRRESEDPFVIEEKEEREQEPEKVHLDDAVGTKKALDAAIIEALREKGIDLDHTIEDTKVAIGLAACLVACVAQFWPAKHPWNWWVCAICVACYALLSAALTFFATTVEKDAITWTKASGNRPALIVSSSMRKASDQWTVSVHPKQLSGAPAKFTKSVGQFVHANGIVATDKVSKAVVPLLDRYFRDKDQ